MARVNADRPIVPRGRIWKKQRKWIVGYYRQTCQYCGCRCGSKKDVDAKRVEAVAHSDHVKPLKHGGEDALWNYVLACETCNKVKSGRWDPDLVVGGRNIQQMYEERKALFAAGKPIPILESPTGLQPFASSIELRGEAATSNNHPVTLETIDRMWLAFYERQSAKFVAKKCGVHHETARKYIDFGDAGRGVEPFSVRLARIRTERTRQVDSGLIQTGARLLRTFNKLHEAMLRKLGAVKGADGEFEITDLAIVPDFRDLVEVGRFINNLAGGVDRRVDHQHRIAQMSDAEIDAELRKVLESGPIVEGELLPAQKALPPSEDEEIDRLMASEDADQETEP
jgi:hypothetical protein